VQTALMNVSFEGNNGHDADVTRCLLMTHSGHCRAHPSPIERRPSHSRESWIPVSELSWRSHDDAINCSD
jgi:hypothetical protein